MSAFTMSLAPPSDADVQLARASSRALGQLAHHSLRVHIDGQRDPIEIPALAVRLLVGLLGEMAAGHAVTVVPMHTDLSTGQAADLLGAGRPFVVGLLAGGKMNYHQVGTHRHILMRDVLDYKQRLMIDRACALDELTDQAQELGLGY